MCVHSQPVSSLFLFLTPEESELTPPPPPSQGAGCQPDDTSSAAVTDTLEPSQSSTSAEKELQSQVGKSVTHHPPTPPLWNMGQKF